MLATAVAVRLGERLGLNAATLRALDEPYERFDGNLAAVGEYVYATTQHEHRIRASGKPFRMRDVMHRSRLQCGKIVEVVSAEDTALTTETFPRGGRLRTLVKLHPVVSDGMQWRTSGRPCDRQPLGRNNRGAPRSGKHEHRGGVTLRSCQPCAAVAATYAPQSLQCCHTDLPPPPRVPRYTNHHSCDQEETGAEALPKAFSV
jgi:hypothetical protein